MEEIKTRCLLCNRICNPSTHICVNKNKWIHYYGRFEAVFDLKKIGEILIDRIEKAKLAFKNNEKINIWNFSEMLPVKKRIDLGEGGTPLYHLKKYLQEYKINLYIKNDGINPSGVYKDRESSIAINRCLERGIKKVTLASTGNAAQSISIYASKANIQTLLFISGKTSKEKIRKMLNNGAKLIILKNGSMEDAFKANRNLSKFLESKGIWDCNPGVDWLRREGSKTIAYEMYAQMDIVPDWIIAACGNGSSLRAIYKGFKEMKDAGIINKLPKMVGVQIEGGDPIPQGALLKQFNKPVEIISPPESLGDSASASFDYFAAVRAITESKGCGIGVTDKEIAKCLSEFIYKENELLNECIPEVVTAQILPALEKLLKEKIIKKNQNVVLFFSSHAINDRDHLKELLLKYGYEDAWKKINPLIPLIKKSKSKLNMGKESKLNIRYVTNDLKDIKKAVIDLMKS